MNKIFKITLVAAVAAVAGYGVYANQKTEGVWTQNFLNQSKKLNN